MNRIFLLLCLSFFSFASFSQPFTSRVAVELDNAQPYHIHLFHADHLWVGRVRGSAEEMSYLDIFDSAATKKLNTISLDYTPTFIAAVNENSVIVIGKSSKPHWQSFVSTITIKNGQFITKTIKLHADTMPEFFAGNGKDWFFNEVGVQGIFRQTTMGPKFLDVKVSGVGKLLLVGEDLFVIQRNSLLAWEDDNLVKINLRTMKKDRVFTENRNWISHLLKLNRHHLVATSEAMGNQIHFIDPTSAKLQSSIPVNSPRALANFYSCVVAGSEAKLITLVRPDLNKTMELSLDSHKTQLNNTRSVATDEKFNRIFVRSEDYCPSCLPTRNVVIALENLSPELMQFCK